MKLLWIAHYTVYAIQIEYVMFCTVSAENIPRTLVSVYRRAKRLFDPKYATGRQVQLGSVESHSKTV